MSDYLAIALSIERPESHRQYVKRIEADNDEDAREKAYEWFTKNHSVGHQFSKYEYLVTKEIPK